MSSFKVQDLINAVAKIPSAIDLSQVVPRRPRRTTTEDIPITRIDPSSDGEDSSSLSGLPNKAVFPIIDLQDEEGESDRKLRDVLQEAKGYGSIWGDIDEEGTDALAWYVSFHYSKNWGIYIPMSGLLFLTNVFYRSGHSPTVSLIAAWNCLLRHELLHYGVDVAMARLELVMQTPVYIPSKNAMHKGGYVHQEEAIANGAMLISIKRLASRLGTPSNHLGIFKIAEDFVTNQPPGYREGKKYASKPSFVAGSNEYLLQALVSASKHVLSVNASSSHLSGLYPLSYVKGNPDQGYMDDSECPIYFVEDVCSASSLGIYFITTVSDIRETPRFKKDVKPFLSEWRETKRKLADPGIPKNLKSIDLKKWPRGDRKEEGAICFSVRVGTRKTNMRAHLSWFQSSGKWVAEEIDDADKTGHHKQKR